MIDHNKDVLCMAHLGWDFVYQRPQHVMSRLAKKRRVVYYEEPRVAEDGRAHLAVRRDGEVTIATPVLPAGLTAEQSLDAQRDLFDEIFERMGWTAPPVLWYYTPMALDFSGHVGAVRVYDCMDELSLFKNAPASLVQREKELLARASVVFTGGRSLYFAKRHAHPNVHCFPSAVDAAHFAPAGRIEPDDLRSLARPRLTFCGVIDERFDIDFVAGLAAELPDWQLFFVGPVVKIDPATLPRPQNVRYAGMRSYDELPAYLEHSDVALLPFALNDATRFISPTKTLEYLAARKPVISTPIADVVDPYGTDGLVKIAHDPRQAAAFARAALAEPPSERWHRDVTDLLDRVSWDATVKAMESLLAAAEVSSLEHAG